MVFVANYSPEAQQSRSYSSCPTQIVYPLNSSRQIHSVSSNHWSNPLLLEITVFKIFAYEFIFFMPGSFHWINIFRFLNGFVDNRITIFSERHRIPLHTYTTTLVHTSVRDMEFCLFPVLATVNSTSMENERETFSVTLASFSLALYPEEGLQHHVTVTRNSLLFPGRLYWLARSPQCANSPTPVAFILSLSLWSLHQEWAPSSLGLQV